MKNYLLLFMIAIFAITGCAKNETIDVNKGHAIDFRAATTRASVVYNYDLQSFWATAVDANDDNFFTNVGFGRAGEYFSSSPAYYWPADGSSLNFWAYYPSENDLDADVSISATEQLVKNFSPKQNFSEQVDFITATAQGSKANEANGVALDFYHRLSQIRVSAKSNNTAYVYKIYGLKVKNLLTNGTFNFATNKWTFDTAGTKDSYTSLFLDNPVTLTNNSSALTETYVNDVYVENSAMVIPQELTAWDPTDDPDNTSKGAYLSVALRIETPQGDCIFPSGATQDYGWAATPLGYNLQMGVCHHFLLDFTTGAGYGDPDEDVTGEILGEPIKFTVTVNPWDEPSAGALVTRQLEGNWLAKEVQVTYTYPDGYEGNKNNDFSYISEEDVEGYFNGNGFYQFSVDNNYTIHMTTPQGVETTSSMTVDDDGYIYLEAFKQNGEYPFLPKVEEVNDVEKKAIVTITNLRNNGEVDYTMVETFIYDKF